MLMRQDDTQKRLDLCVLYGISSVRMVWITCTDIRLHSVVATPTAGPPLNYSIRRILFQTQVEKEARLHY